MGELQLKHVRRDFRYGQYSRDWFKRRTTGRGRRNRVAHPIPENGINIARLQVRHADFERNPTRTSRNFIVAGDHSARFTFGVEKFNLNVRANALDTQILNAELHEHCLIT